VAEAVPGYSVEAWWGVFAPAGTPAPMIAALNEEICASGQAPEIREMYAREGTQGGNLTSMEFQAFLSEELRRWRDLARERRIEAS
jgi:tripartite-type tricarboxylate transporter receptor subunit TctC